MSFRNLTLESESIRMLQQAVHHQHCRELQYGQGTNLDCDFPSDESFSGSDDTTSLSLPLRYDISSKCCSICLEPFQVGERVSWASTNHCNHAFHPSCIQTWLIRHEQCPLCRCRFMLCDDSRRKLPKAKLRALRKEYVKRQQSTYFCIEEGLQSYNNV